MKRTLAALVLTGLFAAGSLTAIAHAQGTKPTAAVKPADPKAVKGSVVVKPDAKGRFRISVKDGDDKTLLMSAGNGFETEKEAKDAIEEIKAILSTAKVTVEKGEEKKDK